MNLLLFLIGFPLALAIVLLVLPWVGARRALVRIGAVILAIATLSLLTVHFNKAILYFDLGSGLINKVMMLFEAVICAYIIYMSIRFKKYWVGVLSLLQTVLIVIFEISKGHGLHIEHNLFIDKFSVIMALVAGVIGSFIVFYASGYMQQFHHSYHKGLKDQRRVFFPILFTFLSAMFGIIFSNNLVWLYFFWEITTLCSFLLIRYKKTAEANENSFRALWMNLLGGLGFVAGIIYLQHFSGIVELDKLLTANKSGIMLGVMFLCFAGLTKSAQLPFSSWLVGAMVAPTPVSALLHSTTMVKAGVYLVLRLAFVLQGTLCGFLVALIGGVTFIIASFIAVSQSDAKKVLAYSTIANLGLIVLCAGIGTYEAVWAGLMLIIFHALAKCLLFLCVGEVEHKIHSRNIEDMEGLIVTMPKLSIMLQIGIAGMFLAPFGMLISKWAVLKALVDTNPLLVVFVVFGSAATVFFWVKWMGKLIIVSHPQPEIESGISRWEWIPLYLLSLLTIAICGFFPLVSSNLVEPYVVEIYGKTFTMSVGNIHIMSIMLAMVMLFPLSFLNYGKRVKVVDAYLGGANTDSRTEFGGFRGEVKSIELKNYSLTNYWPESRLLKLGILITVIFLALMLGVVWI